MIPHIEWTKGAADLIAARFGADTIMRGIGGLGCGFILTDHREGSRTCLIRTSRWGAVDLYFEAHDLGWRLSFHRFDRLARTNPLCPPWHHDEDVTEGFDLDPSKADRAQPGLLALSSAFDALAGERMRLAA